MRFDEEIKSKPEHKEILKDEACSIFDVPLYLEISSSFEAEKDGFKRYDMSLSVRLCKLADIAKYKITHKVKDNILITSENGKIDVKVDIYYEFYNIESNIVLSAYDIRLYKDRVGLYIKKMLDDMINKEQGL